jgi:Arc/MetJ family transcription regulator
MVDQPLLEEAKRALRARTYSEAVDRALREAVRIAKVRGLVDFFGTGAWEGDLAEMRRDRPRAGRRKRG